MKRIGIMPVADIEELWDACGGQLEPSPNLPSRAALDEFLSMLLGQHAGRVKERLCLAHIRAAKEEEG